MDPKSSPPDGVSVTDIADEIANAEDMDILLLNSPIARPLDQWVVQECIGRRRRTNVTLVLITEGGDPDAAYRIARCLQTKYQRFSVYLSGYCKSAGTLIALGAHEIIMSDHGELGPLDVQLTKKDELVDLQSGLTVMTALETIKSKLFLAFEEYFLEIEGKSQGLITVQTAAQQATELARSIFDPIAKQIDPINLGECARALKIAEAYGTRLMPFADNYTEESLNSLMTLYPSHGFVIDRAEAELLFRSVREPTTLEYALATALGDLSRRPAGTHRVQFLTSDLNDQAGEKVDAERQDQGEGAAASGTAESAGEGSEADTASETSGGPSQKDRQRKRPRLATVASETE